MLANFDTTAFLRDHWQRAPLLVRGAFPDWTNPLSPQLLAGLACEPGVEARLITGPDYRVTHGPFDDDDFAGLGASDWTLLVQSVDQMVPRVADLIAPFRFIPDWRIDDVMVSYAAAGGGVGPHFDQYDVFLVQGLGQRRWRIGARCDSETALRPHDDLRLLAEFKPVAEWVLGPGDMLYVPPGVAHDGVAIGDDCMTYSVGFRAPARSELIAGFVEDVLDGLTEDDRYADAGLAAQTTPGLIAPGSLAALHAMVLDRLVDADAFAQWFGRHSTTAKEERDGVRLTLRAVRTALNSQRPVYRSAASRFAMIERADALTLFVDGVACHCPGELRGFARALCVGAPFVPASDTATIDLLRTLLERGSVSFDPPEHD